MKRNVIQKFLRLRGLQEKYEQQIEKLAEQQIEIYGKIIKEYNLEDWYEYRDYVRYDYVRVEEDGRVGLWERAFRDDPAYHLTSMTISQLVIDGNLNEYEKYLRSTLKPQAEQVAAMRLKEKENRKQQLQFEINRINTELNHLS